MWHQTWGRPGRAPLLAVAIMMLAPVAKAQTIEDLVPGRLQEGMAGWDVPASYGFQAQSAGVLTVVVRSMDDTDLFLLVTDSDGQPLVEGRSDQDLGGDTGAEQFAVTIPRAGRYQVHVESFGGGGGPFKLGVSWLPFPDLALPADPDGSPGSALPITLDMGSREDSIDGESGDFWDWFVLKVEKAGTLTVATRAQEGDLVLEAFEPDSFTDALERSDQDLQGNGGNEAVTLVVLPGQEFYFKVSAFSTGASVPYRLQVGFIPE